MTGRELITSILNKQPGDRLAWTTLVDRTVLDNLSPELRQMSAIDFYNYINCDIFLLNGWGTPYKFSSPARVWPKEVQEKVWIKGGKTVKDWDSGEEYNQNGSIIEGTIIQERKTPEGTLTKIIENHHEVKYPVTTFEDINLYRRIWENVKFEARDDTKVYNRLNADIGERGIVTRYWMQSTISLLLEHEMGIENFYYMLTDYPKEMESLFDTIHKKEKEAWEILAQGPWDVTILCEDTSTHYISPDVYRKYNKSHVKDFVDIMHAAGKKALIHMCGHIKDLLNDIKDIGLDGIHFLTAPPTGNTPWELVLDVLGEDLIIVGYCDAAKFISGPVREIPKMLDAIYTPRMRNANLILALPADGSIVSMERFQIAAEWMEKNGKRVL